jgi:2-polyprenyl-6-methoxyphenol hydroxylase-like FAD-dependent oxidoreductase
MSERPGQDLVGVRVGIVGGSLAGCAMAVALSSVGCDVTVLERTDSEMRDRGSGIGLPAPLIQRLRGLGMIDADMPTLSVASRQWRRMAGDAPLGELIWEQGPFSVSANNWNVVFENLRRRVEDARYHVNREVVEIDNRDDGVGVLLADGERLEFDMLVGADGNRSTVRRLIFPSVQTYAGQVIWRGWYDASLIPDPGPVSAALTTVLFPRGNANWWIVPGPYHAPPGARQLAWIIYDTLEKAPFVEKLLDEEGLLRSVPLGACDPEQVAYIHDLARTELPPYFGDLVLADARPLIAPVYDIRLSCYSSGRVVVCGDAATTVSPVTGSGATKGLEDALGLADAIRESGSVEDAVARYDAARWAAGDRLADISRRLGGALVEQAHVWDQVTTSELEDAWNKVMADSPLYMVDGGK